MMSSKDTGVKPPGSRKHAATPSLTQGDDLSFRQWCGDCRGMGGIRVVNDNGKNTIIKEIKKEAATVKKALFLVSDPPILSIISLLWELVEQI